MELFAWINTTLTPQNFSDHTCIHVMTQLQRGKNMLTEDVLRALYPKAPDDHVAAFAAQNADLFGSYGIDDNDNRLQFFLAQIGHESGGLTITTENLNYSAPRMCQVWPSRFPTLTSALACEHKPELLANTVYCNRMGNGDAGSGDGWRYRGRGYIQITGRDAYEQIGAIAGLDLVGVPDLAFQPDSALHVACAFWKWKTLNTLCDGGDFTAVTKRINGGITGLPERQAWLDKVRRTLLKTLDTGMELSTAQVVALQRALRVAGYTEVGVADGDIGQHTTAAIMRFRHDQGLPDGVLIDEALLDALNLPVTA